MNTRRSMKLPIIGVFLFIIIIVSFFSSIKQKEVTCKKTKSYSSGIYFTEEVISKIEGKKIKSIDVTKTISLTGKSKKEDIDNIIKSLDKTLEYLGKNVKYTISEDKIIIEIHVKKKETILLDNITFSEENPLEIKIDSNTKSSNVLTLGVTDSYTDGEYMKLLRQRGYQCK